MNQTVIESALRICLQERHVRNGHSPQLHSFARSHIERLRRLRALVDAKGPAARA